MSTPKTSPHASLPKPASRARRVLGTLALGMVLGLSFLGYLTPSMRIQWENFMSMCGF